MKKMASGSALRPRARRLAKLVSHEEKLVSGTQALAAGVNIYIHFIGLTKDLWSVPSVIPSGVGPWSEDAQRVHEKRLADAAARYLKFGEMRRGGGESEALVPTRDISLMWAADMLRPSSYEQTDGSVAWWYKHQQMRLLESGCPPKLLQSYSAKQVLFSPYPLCFSLAGLAITKDPLGVLAGFALGVLAGSSRKVAGSDVTAPGAAALRPFNKNGSGVLSKDQREAGLRPWRSIYRHTEQRWLVETNSPYRMALKATNPPALKRSLLPQSEAQEERAKRLAVAVASQGKFHRRLLSLGPAVVFAPGFIERAVERYCGFLALAKAHPGELLVPSLDVDLAWHAHMLSPADYRDDCAELLNGRTLSHDTAGFAEGELGEAFERTKEKWRAMHGSEYVRAPQKKCWSQRNQRNEQKSDAYPSFGCGSCGWEDDFDSFHKELPHKQIEDAIVAESGSGNWAAEIDHEGRGWDAVWEDLQVSFDTDTGGNGGGDGGGGGGGGGCGGD